MVRQISIFMGIRTQPYSIRHISYLAAGSVVHFMCCTHESEHLFVKTCLVKSNEGEKKTVKEIVAHSLNSYIFEFCASLTLA